ncbi:MAG: 2-C-methyl-D-erythritol 4-phosphate cytidylyltransferase [Candidatus Marinimicrobia bacterium]|jgi:2-C-methyl-D-erythritol 4-phosphate cytidylyltransferase|nr:2-C-methyl-D-erythritol 4-phosphate cytidylyltransferase [Candidatus Neomarinimicrobiota bacterium]|tara:strand:+ start:1422 stop:2093 length:672 start_codon:yes stop_codon:yes gene_type:complete
MVKSLFNVGAVLPAAGIGTRFGEKKQFKYLANKPLFLYALNIFLKCKEITEIVIVTNKEDVEYIYKETESLKTKKHIKVIAGGPRRQDSVMNGCLALSNSIEFVTIHDIVRPFVTNDIILSTILGCNDSDGCIAALLSNDTVKEVKNLNIVRTIDRDKIWLAQTPQTFKIKVLLEAMTNHNATDEASMVEAAGGAVTVTEGSIMNFKITTSDDWKLAEKVVYG